MPLCWSSWSAGDSRRGPIAHGQQTLNGGLLAIAGMTDTPLERLGFDVWFRDRHPEPHQPGCTPARVSAVDRDRYLVRDADGEMPAELSGALRFSVESSADLPCVGDWASVRLHNDRDLAIVHALFPRKSLLQRKTPGRQIDYQLVAANVDVAFLVQSCDADFSLRRLERYLAMVHEARTEPRMLLTKGDLLTPVEVEERIAAVRQTAPGLATLAVSNRTGAGLDELDSMLEAGKTYCLLGSSGVGKTTILNRLAGRDQFETGPVREYDGKGRHTTARRQLIMLDGGAMLIDTPGMRELGAIGMSDGIDESFADIVALAACCRFADCTHTQEAGCALLAAVERGDLDRGRYGNYLQLARESAYHEMSYLQRRKKDRAFGRMVKSAMKHKKE
jgi:ribosome biogenesis GTPase